MTVHRVALADCPPQPWHNGGGTTRELLVWPRAAGWALRVSVARIDRSGPFSAYPGVQRCFAVLRGEGVWLDLPQGPCRLAPADAPVTFDGAAAPGCRLLEGATEDLNLMARLEAGRPRMRTAVPGSAVTGRPRWRALFATAPAVIDVGGAAHALAADTLAWTDAADAPPWRLVEGAQAHWLTLEA